MKFIYLLMYVPTFLFTPTTLATTSPMNNNKPPLPQAASEALVENISAFPHFTKEEVKASTPGTNEAWRNYAHARNSEQKKKIKKMKKELNVDVELMKLNGVVVRKLTPKAITPEFKDKVYLDFHGGAFVLFGGLPSIEEGLLVAERLGIVVYSVDYRMPPTFPFPAALNDVVAVYNALLDQVGEGNVFVGGTSAGGGLVLSLVQSLISSKSPLPKAVYAGTPWADLTKTSDSLYTNESIDGVLVTYDGVLEAAAKLYAGKRALTEPAISPLYGSFEAFPPTLLVTGTRDMFLSDTVRVNRAIRDAGGVAQIEIFEGLSHAEYLIFYKTPESKTTYKSMKSFFLSTT
ncbi:alpha/beta hydrolase [Alteromonas sp. ALT199]|uniref:alpha/beta hydrolase n=1 Tax=unclassified Alteromonas TaxID=2614992 RepID=UPI001BE9816B|nr:alpha/beta hydrolase [Alteromonas sp. ALT199]MBT3137273.1 alpha/beta hydrolase [Alteromonas sp. ALT199]